MYSTIKNNRVENVAGLCRNYSNEGTEDGNASDARFSHPLDITFRSDGALVIADSFNDRIRLLSADKSNVTTLSGSQRGYLDGDYNEAMFDVPRSVVADYVGNIYVAESVNMRIRVITAE